MQTKDVLLVVGGVALGYLASTMLVKGKTAPAVQDVLVEGGEKSANPIRSLCEQQWSVFSQTIKPESESALKTQKEAFILSCLNNQAGTGGFKPSK